MAITRTALGAVAGAPSFTLVSSLALATDDLLIVGAGCQSGPANIICTWNSITLTVGQSHDDGVSKQCRLLYLAVTSGATSNLQITAGANPTVAFAVKYSGLTSWTTDSTGAGASGSSTTPASGASGSVAGSGIVCGVIYLETSIGNLGTWSTFSDGQSVASGLNAITEGFINPTTATTYNAAKTGTANVGWEAVVRAFKGTAAAFDPSSSWVDQSFLKLPLPVAKSFVGSMYAHIDPTAKAVLALPDIFDGSRSLQPVPWDYRPRQVSRLSPASLFSYLTDPTSGAVLPGIFDPSTSLTNRPIDSRPNLPPRRTQTGYDWIEPSTGPASLVEIPQTMAALVPTQTKLPGALRVSPTQQNLPEFPLFVDQFMAGENGSPQKARRLPGPLPGHHAQHPLPLFVELFVAGEAGSPQKARRLPGPIPGEKSFIELPIFIGVIVDTSPPGTAARVGSPDGKRRIPGMAANWAVTTVGPLPDYLSQEHWATQISYTPRRGHRLAADDSQATMQDALPQVTWAWEEQQPGPTRRRQLIVIGPQIGVESNPILAPWLLVPTSQMGQPPNQRRPNLTGGGVAPVTPIIATQFFAVASDATVRCPRPILATAYVAPETTLPTPITLPWQVDVQRPMPRTGPTAGPMHLDSFFIVVDATVAWGAGPTPASMTGRTPPGPRRTASHEAAANPPWIACGLIIVSGPFSTVAGDLIVAGAVAGGIA